MSKGSNTSGFAGRLWGGGREPSFQPDEKVVPPEIPPAVRPAAPHDRAYVAFEIRERADRLHIMRCAGPSRFPNYHLLDISFDHHLQSAFTLIYMAVGIRWHVYRARAGEYAQMEVEHTFEAANFARAARNASRCGLAWSISEV